MFLNMLSDIKNNFLTCITLKVFFKKNACIALKVFSSFNAINILKP